MSQTGESGMTMAEVLIATFLLSLVIVLGLKVIAMPMEMNIRATQSAYVRTEQKSSAEAFFALIQSAERLKLVNDYELHVVQRGSNDVSRYKIKDDLTRLNHKNQAAYKILAFSQLSKAQYKNYLDNLDSAPWAKDETVTTLYKGCDSRFEYDKRMQTMNIELYLQYGSRIERLTTGILRYVWLKNRIGGGNMEFHDGF